MNVENKTSEALPIDSDQQSKTKSINNKTSNPINHRIIDIRDTEYCSHATRIDDSQTYSTIWDYLRDDKALLLFFKLCQFHWVEGSSHGVYVDFITKFKLFAFSIFGIIGFVWQIVIGVKALNVFFISLTNATLSQVFLHFGKVVIFLLSPLLQVLSIAFILYKITIDINAKDRDLTFIRDEAINESKRDAFICFLPILIILLFVFSSFSLTKKYEDNVDDVLIDYSSEIFLYVCSNFFFLLNLTQYLAVCMFFINLHLKESLLAQREFLIMLGGDIALPSHLHSIRKGSVSSQVIDLCGSLRSSFTKSIKLFFIKMMNSDDVQTVRPMRPINISIAKYKGIVEPIAYRITRMNAAMQFIILSAMLNSLSLLFLIWYLIRENSSEIGLKVIVYLPFVLKEVVFFFYVLWKGVKINSLHDEIKKKLSDQVLNFVDNPNESDAKKMMMVAIQNHTTVNPIAFKLLGVRVSKNNFWFVVISFIGTLFGIMTRFREIVNTGEIR